ncbi:hypothetical protein N657DRAFT_639007 [Parathielavia appendiculata]|uniref:Uncharacterized protein n=1 Tax=Parathielavia appendiculata TaxID=2587402 RepID=A0AAN6U9S1_9PEZI|nr:hypothetical protein N657DRAFT_639007 [Parathielavia appendiculata]
MVLVTRGVNKWIEGRWLLTSSLGTLDRGTHTASDAAALGPEQPGSCPLFLRFAISLQDPRKHGMSRDTSINVHGILSMALGRCNDNIWAVATETYPGLYLDDLGVAGLQFGAVFTLVATERPSDDKSPVPCCTSDLICHVKISTCLIRWLCHGRPPRGVVRVRLLGSKYAYAMQQDIQQANRIIRRS